MPTTEAPAEPEAEEPEVVTPEVVAEAPPAGQAVERVREESPSAARANDAIVAASEAAIANPGIPGRDEFLALAMQARILSMSGAAPKLVRDNPHLAFHVAMVGRDLGISPSAALELIDVIDGRNGPQLSLSPQLLNGQIRRLGLGSIIPVVKTPTRCVAVALGPGGRYDQRCKREWPDHHELCTCTHDLILGESEFDWDEARTAGLVLQGCEVGNHTNHCKDRGTRGSCNSGYVSYPKRMMWWRCAGFLADDIFPEASLGLYSPEALGAVVDEDGRPIDPAAVELPPGYEPKAVGAGSNGAPKEAQPPAAREDLEDLAIRVEALPDEQREMLKARWLDSNRLRPHKIDELPEAELTLAASMVKGFEAIATKAGWDPAAARAEVLERRGTASPPQEAAEGSESPGEPDAADESPGEHTEPRGPSDGDESPGDEPERERAAPDPAVAAWVRDISGAAPADLTASTVAEVKAMHHAVVNRELLERGWDPADQHIDTRRMVLTAARLEEHMHPDRCIIIRCEEPRAETPEGELPAALCTGHTTF